MHASPYDKWLCIFIFNLQTTKANNNIFNLQINPINKQITQFYVAEESTSTLTHTESEYAKGEVTPTKITNKRTSHADRNESSTITKYGIVWTKSVINIYCLFWFH